MYLRNVAAFTAEARKKVAAPPNSFSMAVSSRSPFINARWEARLCRLSTSAGAVLLLVGVEGLELRLVLLLRMLPEPDRRLFAEAPGRAEELLVAADAVVAVSWRVEPATMQVLRQRRPRG